MCPLIGSFEEIDELGSLVGFGLPHRDDVKTVAPHAASGMIAEAGVERVFGGVENLINPQLVKRANLASFFGSSGRVRLRG